MGTRVLSVMVGENIAPNPWTGGLTAPQWSPFDADMDGVEDLFAFDRDGDRVLVFERVPSDLNEEDRFTWDGLVSGWPKWPDGAFFETTIATAMNIFTSHQNGIRVYTNTTEPGSAQL